MTTRIALVVLLAAIGCCTPSRPADSASTITAFRGGTMGTSFSIKVVLPPGVERDQTKAKIDQTLIDFDLLFSTYNKNSEISRFNAHRGDQPFVATEPFAALVGRAMTLAERTGGAFDPTMGPLLRLYGRGPGAEKVDTPPSDEALAKVRKTIGWQLLQVSGLNLSKQSDTLELDLNAIAKGAGVDAVARTLDGLGSLSYMVEIGGEVRCKGTKPGDVQWRLGISQPGGTGFADRVALLDAGMATSGTYLQFKQLGGTKVHHIVDPRTGRNPDNKVVSVTVIAPTCELADALATALLVLGPDAGGKILEMPEFKAVKALFLVNGDTGIEPHKVRW